MLERINSKEFSHLKTILFLSNVNVMFNNYHIFEKGPKKKPKIAYKAYFEGRPKIHNTNYIFTKFDLLPNTNSSIFSILLHASEQKKYELSC